MHIKNKILITFLTVAIISVLAVAMTGFFSARGSLLRTNIRQLETLRDLKSNAILTFFDGLEDNISIAQDYYNIKTNLPILNKFSKDRSNPDFIKAKEMLDGQLRNWLKIKEEVNDIMLVGPEGKVLYSANEGNMKLELDKPLPDPEGIAFEKGKKGIYVSQIFRSPNDSYGYKFGLIVTAPIFDFKNQFIGVVAFQIDMYPVYKLIQDATGLEKTGETLVVRKEGDHILFLNSLRHDPDAALKRRTYFGDKTSIPAQESISGRIGSGIVRDYRNEKVLSAWRYIPTLGWGIVAKIDLQEVLAPVIELRNKIVIFCLVIIILVMIVSLAIARSISRPIHMLHKGAEIIGSGNLDYKIGIGTKDEIGQLSRAFDQMAENLKGIQDKLVRSEKLAIIGQLASSVAHELRNPLGVMKNVIYYLNMLDSTKNNPEFKENLDIINQEIDNSDKIITDLLEFSRTKKPIFHSENINFIIKEILNRLRILSNIELILELRDDLPDIEVDALQMHQVFYNITKNALEAMEKGGKLRIKTELKADAFVEVSVSDTGSGISKEDIAKIFEPLFSTKIKGTGLGLSICASIIERHNGKIQVNSEVGKGTTFIVKLPVKRG